MKSTIFIFVLTLVMAGSAIAQRGFEAADLNVPAISVKGEQTAAGNPDAESSVVRGNTFMMVGADRQSNYSLSVSVDYTPNADEVQVSDVAGGSWTLSIYRDGNLVGTVFGDMVGGSITEVLNEDTTLGERDITANFRIQGGTGEYDYVAAEDEPSGTLTSVTGADGVETKATIFNVLKK
jgi:hypothetical protein